MNTKHISLAAIAIVAVLTGCTKNPIEAPSDSKGLADLELTSVNSVQTKAAIDGTTFPTDGEIGLFLFENEMATQTYGDGYENIRYTYNSTKEKWTASPSIKVGGTPGYLYGYYPYNSTATDIKAIPVASSLNGDDVMYASTQEVITDMTAANTTITMNHALARVSITVKNNGYTGDAKLTSIKFTDAKTSLSGSLDATSGAISGTTRADITLAVPSDNQTITSDGTTYECLLVPSEKEESKQTVKLNLTIDGEDKTATLSGDNGVIFAQGTKSNITITLSNKGISVSSVSVDDWKVVEVGGHKVTIKLAEVTGIEKDIMVTAYAEGASVIVMAQAASGKSIECILPEDKLCGCTKCNNIYKFIISDIVSDLTATVDYSPVSLNKYALNLIKNYGHYRLIATVQLAAADDKTLIWSSSDESVATVDQNGFVKALATGSSTISAKTKVGGHTDICTVMVVEPQSRPDGALPGYFSVSDNTVVYFSKGNLYCRGVEFNYDGTMKSMDNAQWGFEANQYDTTPSRIGFNDNRDNNHISHFLWCNTAEKAIALTYDLSWYGETQFFVNAASVFTGYGVWRVLTGGYDGEWKYLLDTRITAYGENRRYAAVKVNSMAGILIFPDDFSSWPSEAGDEPQTFNTNSSNWNDRNYSVAQFLVLQNNGCVFLPAAALRYGNDGSARIDIVGNYGYYWSSTPNGDDIAYSLNFDSDDVSPANGDLRYYACSVRLVTDVK